MDSTLNKQGVYIFHNPHPKGLLVGDCVKRAFTVATEKAYREVSIELNRLKRELNEKAFNSDKVWREYVKRMGWKKLSFKAIPGEPRMTAKQMATLYPKGTYLLRMARHLATMKDGKLLDTWDSSEKCVYVAWKVQ